MRSSTEHNFSINYLYLYHKVSIRKYLYFLESEH